MSDWLGYCIVTGDEIDAQVFGHHHPFRDQKRRWVFELAYGLYDAEVAKLAAALKSVEIKIGALDREEELQKKFLAETPFSSSEALVRRIAEIDSALAENATQSVDGVAGVIATFDVGKLREDLLLSRAKTRQAADEIRKNEGQLKDLTDLLGQLKSQFSRLTRAIISDEWLVDFDFVVCPRCGSDVEPARATDECCYLCLQTPSSSSSREAFLAEQDRIVTQIQETESVIASRRESLSSLRSLHAELSEQEEILSAQLNSRTQTFVSDRESQIAESASNRAHLAAERNKAEEYLRILERFQLTFSSRQELEEQKAEIEDKIARRELTTSVSEAYIELLEDRILGYLSQLNVPHFDAGLSVTINRKTYLPEISGRTFDELSSQGLKTLVNVAHSLAHHTVAIDNNLPMPGLLVLDGLSANAGRRGFDEDRIRDMYQLLISVSEEYGDRLQIIAVDNDPPADLWGDLSSMEVLHLTQEDKLIRFPSVAVPNQTEGTE
ncbi:hypothetical protein [Streptomyces griseoaurantiacus]|uniref:hypothetical protein n=1 Tax=Streptomyces griseoaurantiacus TaxID=68213 RepID=UPI00362C035F